MFEVLIAVRIKGYIGDLKDGIHHGDADDPRVSAIQVIPDEIHYWFTTKGVISRTIQVAAASIMGHATAPGEMRTITKKEVSLTHQAVTPPLNVYQIQSMHDIANK